MTRTHTLHATTREWTDGEGRKHKHRIEVGAIFTSNKGRMVVKIDAIPITKEFSGWLAAEPSTPYGMPPAASSPELGSAKEQDTDSDIPF